MLLYWWVKSSSLLALASNEIDGLTGGGATNKAFKTKFSGLLYLGSICFIIVKFHYDTSIYLKKKLIFFYLGLINWSPHQLFILKLKKHLMPKNLDLY